MKYRPEIDGLRAVAVLAVILFHAELSVCAGGFVGVDVFFVISGYLITSILVTDRERGGFSILGFYERRARRILPALFVVIAVCVPVAWLLLIPADLVAFGRSVVAVAMFASNVLFWLESGYFDTEASLKPLLHTWSLAVEEQFYLLFPLLVVVLWRFGKRTLIIVLVAIAVVSLVAAEHYARVLPAATFLLAPTRAWELLLGALVALFGTRTSRLGNLASGAGLAMVLVSVFVFDSATPFPSLFALLPTTGTALIIVFASSTTLVGRVLSTRGLVAIGLVSYSAYLWHQPLVVFARHVVVHGPSTIVQVALSLSAIPLGYVTWRFVETPFRNRALFTRNRIFAFALLGSIACFGAGFATYRFGGGNLAPRGPDNAYAACAERPCYVGNRAAKDTIVLLGDSHAHQLLAALVETFGRDYKIAPLVCNSCFLGDRVRFDKDAESADELARTRAGVARLASEHVVAVIRVQRWQGYGIDARAGIESAISDSISALGVTYDQLVIVGSTTNVELRCRVARALGKLRIGDCAEDAHSRAANDMFATTTRAMPHPANVHFVYPSELICPDGRCKVLDDGILYYRDDHHLTDAGAALVVREIQRIVPELRAPH